MGLSVFVETLCTEKTVDGNCAVCGRTDSTLSLLGTSCSFVPLSWLSCHDSGSACFVHGNQRWKKRRILSLQVLF